MPGRRGVRLHPRRSLPRLRSVAEYKELLAELEGLDDAQLAGWVAGHRDRLSLPFLGWLSDEELAAASDGPDRRQQRIWELGSKLMALREGLSPVGTDVLQAELRAAALRCGGAGSLSDSSDSEDDRQAGRGGSDQPQDVQQQAGVGGQQQLAAPAAALATPGFGAVVQQAAALGLSSEGLALFQQQAAALEAVVGTSRARSLTEVIGRARVDDPRQLAGLAEADAAVRILDVLLGVPDRGERADMLPDAFTPPSGPAAGDDDAAYYAPGDDDQVFTTPMRLLQAVDLYLARLEGSASAGSAHQHVPALASGGLCLSVDQTKAVLLELREDVEAHSWAGSDCDA